MEIKVSIYFEFIYTVLSSSSQQACALYIEVKLMFLYKVPYMTEIFHNLALQCVLGH